jgi:lactate dehydrogenase-like 2-hydroxyacid dehydrogenase
MGERHKVAIARLLLPAGAEMLADRFDVVSGGLDADPTQVRALVRGAAAVVADPTVPVDAGLLDAAGPGLRAVANFAVGYDNVDLEACRARGVIVTNTPDVLTNATAELALALTLAAARHLPETERLLRAGEWGGWDPGAHRGLELSGATVGVVGLGRIGTRYAELLGGFGVDLLHASRSPRPEVERRLDITPVSLDDLLRRSDAVSLHVPATPDTHHLIDAEALALMKPTAVLVNTSRGGLVDLEALAAALREGRIGGAGLDVFEGEPEVPGSILSAPRTALTPHIGSATVKARDGMARTVAENVIAVLEGGEAPNRIA